MWRNGDFNVLTFTHSNTEIGTVDSLSTNLRFPIGGCVARSGRAFPSTG